MHGDNAVILDDQHADVGPDDRARWGAVLALIVLGALVVRLLIATLSIGTNDAFAYFQFADDIRRLGLVRTYQTVPLFNHPPLVGQWAAMLLRTVAPTAPVGGHYPQYLLERFSILFKLPVIAADGIAVWLVWLIWRRRTSPGRAVLISSLAAWSVSSILISGFHCNTDPVYAMLCLASVYMMEDRRAFVWSGVLLGAAVNVKIVPLLLVPPLLLSCPDLASTRRFLLGLSTGIIPLLPVLFGAFRPFVSHVLGYNSLPDYWGFNCVLMLERIGATAYTYGHAAGWYHVHARYLILALVLIWSLAARLCRGWDRYHLAAMTFATFLVFTPGFGAQYLAMIGMLLFASRPRFAVMFAVLAGVFTTVLYVGRLTPGAFPFQAYSAMPLTAWESALGLTVWSALLYFLATSPISRAAAQTMLEVAPKPEDLALSPVRIAPLA